MWCARFLENVLDSFSLVFLAYPLRLPTFCGTYTIGTPTLELAPQLGRILDPPLYSSHYKSQLVC